MNYGPQKSTVKGALRAQLAIIAFNYVFTYISLLLQKPDFEKIQSSSSSTTFPSKNDKSNMKMVIATATTSPIDLDADSDDNNQENSHIIKNNNQPHSLSTSSTIIASHNNQIEQQQQQQEYLQEEEEDKENSILDEDSNTSPSKNKLPFTESNNVCNDLNPKGGMTVGISSTGISLNNNLKSSSGTSTSTWKFF